MRQYVALAVSALITLGLALSQGWSDQVVFLKDGRRIIGQVTKTDEGYEIKTPSGGTFEVTSQSVLKVEDAKSLRQQLQDRLDRVDPNDAEGLYQIARLADDNMLLDEARQILEQALKVKPEFENAKKLLAKVNSKIQDVKTSRPVEGASTSTPAQAQPAQAKLPEEGIDQEDIYRIRRALYRPGEPVLQVEFRNDVVDRFLADQQGSEDFKAPNTDRQFRALRPLEKARYMLDKLDRDSKLREDILIKSDPQAMVAFKKSVWPVIQNNCAAVNCHGGPNAPASFRLFVNPSPSLNEKTLYTNFAIINGYGDQIQGKVRGQMIDSRQVEDSLLLQLGLPEKLSKTAHPAEITPPFKTANDGPYRTIREWIRNLPVIPGGLSLDYYRQFKGAGAAASAPVPPPNPRPSGRPGPDSFPPLR